MSKPSIIYYGTPDFAVAPLELLLKRDFNVLAVVTAPDKPAGRGKKLNASPVKQYAQSLDPPLTVFQPVKLKDESFLNQIRKLNPDLQVVIAFRMMPGELWSVPRMGTFNLHASLLPQYRGAAPINRAIMNGEKETGLTTFLIDDKIDTGEILLQRKMNIGENETAGELHDRMMPKGSELVAETASGLASGNLKPRPQSMFPSGVVELKSAPKIFKEDCKINWTEPTVKVFNHIRGLSPYPAAYSYLNTQERKNIQVKLFKSGYELVNSHESPGTILSDNKTYLKVRTTDGFILVRELQLAGKKRMETTDFLRGFQDIKSCRMD